MRSVAFLTTDLGPGYVTDDHLAVPLLRERGVEVSFVRWRELADWSSYDLVVVRSTWDYHRHLGAFSTTLATIDAATHLENPLALVRWNLRKTYLRDLAGAGVRTVPTAWRPALRRGALRELAAELGVDDLVLKPVVGSSGDDTFRVRADDSAAREAELLAVFGTRATMAQPFLEGVLERGERSVVWIAGRVSHALSKTPRAGEFRSQEEHGGRVERIEPEEELAAAAAAVAAVVARRSPRPALYGRVDFLPGPDGWLVGELELVEPSLYLRLDPGAPARFADAILAALKP